METVDSRYRTLTGGSIRTPPEEFRGVEFITERGDRSSDVRNDRTVRTGTARRLPPRPPETMNVVDLSDADIDLIERAVETIRPVYVPGSDPGARAVGAALRTESGAVYTGVNLTAATPRASVCAEPVAVGAAVTDGETAFDTIVAVLFRPDAADQSEVDGGELFPDAAVISACGVCRELIRDYDPSTCVVVRTDDGLGKAPADELVPALAWRTGGT